MFIKSIIGITLASVTASTLAAPVLPFVGSRDFNFMGGSGTGSTIQIKKDASVLIKSCGVTTCTTDYHGSFKPLIPDGNGGYYKFTTTKVYWLDGFKKPNTGCSGEEAEPCIADLYR